MVTRVQGRARQATAIAVALIAIVLAAHTPTRPPVAAVELPPALEIIDPTFRPLGPISVLGDSLLRGALNTSPNIVTELAARGWGPIRALGVPGMSSGDNGRFPPLTARFWYDQWVVEGWDPQPVVLVIGANDVGLCDHFDQACMDRSIRYIVDHIGSDHDIFIPHINHFFIDEWATPYNRALDALAAERPYLDTWSWDLEVRNGTWAADDVVHLTTTSYHRWSRLTANEVGKDLIRTTHSGGSVSLPTPIADPAGLIPVAPMRLLDTRADEHPRATPTSPVIVDLDGLVSDDATAVALYVTAARASAAGFLSVDDCAIGESETSQLNFTTGHARGAQVVTPVGASRELCIAASANVDVIVDLQGAFAPNGIAFDAQEPRRLVDTRQTGRSDTIQLDFAPHVDAAALTITATRGSQAGFVQAHPCGTPPGTAHLNYGAFEVIASSAYVATSTTGSICVTTSTAVDLVIDVTGTFHDGATLGFQPVTPTRVLDTRDGIWNPWHSKHVPLRVRSAPDDAEAVTGTLVMRRPWERGFLSTVPCSAASSQPTTSSVNAAAFDTIANGITTAVEDGRLCVSTSIATHSILDITGWWRPIVNG